MTWIYFCVLPGAAAAWTAWYLLGKHPVSRPKPQPVPVESVLPERLRMPWGDDLLADEAALAAADAQLLAIATAECENAAKRLMNPRPGVVAPADSDVPTSGEMQ